MRKDWGSRSGDSSRWTRGMEQSWRSRAEKQKRAGRLRVRRSFCVKWCAGEPGAHLLRGVGRSRLQALGALGDSNSTAWPSFNDCSHQPTIAEKWTNTSSPLWRWMNPKPLLH